jgi:excisionase family DNA binding protein
MREKIYTTFQIADICGVRPTTIIKWVKQKKIKAYVTLGGHRRIQESDLLQFLKEHDFPIPKGMDQPQRRILIVEDDDAVGNLLQKAFKKAAPEAEVKWTQDGIGALLAMGDLPPDLMVLDVVMPVVDGASVLATLRSDPRTRKIKVVGITGKTLSSEKLKHMQRHTEFFFLKPFDINQMVQKSLSLIGITERAPLASASRTR